MSIDITCSCGKRLRAKAEYAGRRFKCPACEQLLSIPVQLEQVQLLDELSPSASVPVATPARSSPNQAGPEPQRAGQPGPRYEIISGFFWPSLAQASHGWRRRRVARRNLHGLQL